MPIPEGCERPARTTWEQTPDYPELLSLTQTEVERGPWKVMLFEGQVRDASSAIHEVSLALANTPPVPSTRSSYRAKVDPEGWFRIEVALDRCSPKTRQLVFLQALDVAGQSTSFDDQDLDGVFDVIHQRATVVGSRRLDVAPFEVPEAGTFHPKLHGAEFSRTAAGFQLSIEVDDTDGCRELHFRPGVGLEGDTCGGIVRQGDPLVNGSKITFNYLLNECVQGGRWVLQRLIHSPAELDVEDPEGLLPVTIDLGPLVRSDPRWDFSGVRAYTEETPDWSVLRLDAVTPNPCSALGAFHSTGSQGAFSAIFPNIEGGLLRGCALIPASSPSREFTVNIGWVFPSFGCAGELQLVDGALVSTGEAPITLDPPAPIRWQHRSH